MRNKYILWLVLWMPQIVQAQEQNGLLDKNRPEEIARFLAGIKRVKSYDVTYTLEQSSNTGDGIIDPRSMVTLIYRDVLGFGLGRRFEFNIEDNGNKVIAIKDWKTATSSFKPLFFSLSIALNTYLSYLNPSHFHQCFLTDMLESKKSVITRADPSEAGAILTCFKIAGHPALRGQFMKIWLNPERNYALSRLSSYYAKDKAMILTTTTEIKKDFQVEDNLWVPMEAAFIQYYSISNRIIPSIMTIIRLDEKHCAFNSIKTGDLFQPQSVPVVNWKEDNWSYCYPTQMIEQVKALAKSRHERWMRNEKYGSRWPFYLTMGLVFIVIPIFLRRRKGPLQSAPCSGNETLKPSGGATP